MSMGAMHALDVVGAPARRRILELLVGGEKSAGELVEVLHDELGLSQPAVSQHLKVLRESGFAEVRVDGQRRLYALNDTPLREVDAWLAHFRALWDQPLDALATEIARGKRERRLQAETAASSKTATSAKKKKR